MIRAVFFDVDGTLYSHVTNQVPESARDAIAKLRSRGIAVGLACEIPSHNLREVADACLALLKKPDLSDEELFALLPGPDYPGGGHIISSAARDVFSRL